MGLDPQTHEPAPTFSGPSTKPPATPSTRHMAQWESARLEAEARLSSESLQCCNPHSSVSHSADHFLRLWNSEVGESFRKVGFKERIECQSPISQASTSTTKCASTSGLTMDNRDEETVYKKVIKSEVDTHIRSDSSSSNEVEDSSECALQLLLDFPGNNDMSFLEDPVDDYSIFPYMMNSI